MRDLDDALDGADDLRLEDQATLSRYADITGRHRYGVATVDDLGAPPDTVYDDYQEDVQ